MINKLSHFSFLLSFFISTHSLFSQVADCQDIKEKLYAVHVTDIFPEQGSLRAGFGKKPFSDPQALLLYPDIRMTVHFSLGEMVREIYLDQGTLLGWEDKKYAVILPLGEIVPQLIAVNCYDTFTLGSVFIDNPATTLVIPHNELALCPKKHAYKVCSYDPKWEKIRHVVERVIGDRGGWEVRMVPHSEGEISPALLGDLDINTSFFFAPLKHAFPYLSIVGLRWDYSEGGDGYLFGALERKVLPVVTYLLSETFVVNGRSVPLVSTEELEEGLRDVLMLTDLIDQFVARAPYSPLQKLEYEDKRFALETWIHIITLEIQLNKEEGRTLRGASRQIWKEVDATRSSFHELKTCIYAHLQELPRHLGERTNEKMR